MTTVTTRMPRALALVATLAMTVMAGCLDDSQETEPAVTADLHAERERAWSGEAITFDAQASEAEDEITRYVFDFGDGQTFETSDVDEARLDHAYETGGVYLATVTVYTEADNASASETITVDARHMVDETLIDGPVGTENETRNMSFEAHPGVETLALNLSIEDHVLIGESRATVRILDADDEVLFEETVAVDDGTTVLDRAVAYGTPGDVVLEIEAESGAMSVTGTFDLLYAA